MTFYSHSSSYNALHCSGCKDFIGVVLYSTPPHLAALRSLFLLKKDNMYCYVFNTGQLVKASTLNLNTQRTLSERLSELKRLIQEVECNLDNVSALMDDGCMDDMTTSSVQ
ncbi:hypothetical protein DPEC_G00312550 [Dallia pectoralis]|uniref:Uncharacterized protein n=1 Tax=Dallia pectoralis TaxID=75939 RepID=A0ACC2FBP7_DALPE|nr:hypothetical protein DPEC_G00312550 [Dallia pectoralis]